MPDNATFFSKTTSIGFVVKNLDNRRIHIFNYPINPQQTRDLLAIPEISESDIRHSLIKGQLANFIRLGVITIVSSSIDLTQYDPQQQQFLTTAGLTSTSALGSIIFGASHSNNAPHLNGITSVSFATLSNNIYTLTRDVFFTDGVIIDVGITLFTAGFRVFCNGTLINNGLIHNDGKNAALGVAGGSSSLGSLGIGTAGGNGGTNGIGTHGVNNANGLPDTSGVGGIGGSGGANAGGVGGTYTSFASETGGTHYLTALLSGFVLGQQSGGNSAAVNIMGGGSGGGGGGSDNGGVVGGGGGGGGGVMCLHVLNLINNGIIRCAGGTGAAASGSGGNGGGGGGGAGGLINSICRFRSGTGTMTCSGGNGGAGLGTGGSGTSGNTGHINAFSA